MGKWITVGDLIRLSISTDHVKEMGLVIRMMWINGIESTR